MTHVEHLSTVRGRARTWLRSMSWLCATLAVTATTVVASGSPPAGADPLSDARAQAAALNAEIEHDAAVLDETAQQYEEATGRVQTLDAQLSQVQSQIAQMRQQVLSTQANLRQQALQAYTSGAQDNGLANMFSSGVEQASVANEYQTVASGNLSGTIDRLHQAQSALAAEQGQLQQTEQQAKAAAAQVASAQQGEQAALASRQQTLSQVNGQIATLVQQQQQAEEQARMQRYLAAVQAQQQAAAAAARSTTTSPRGGGGGGSGGSVRTSSGGGGGSAQPSVAPSGSGGAAVQAAESQLGVPYVWGGESPGNGFDCSGLTQWSWAQAGVSIPRTAQDQYDAIEHVSLDALQPGDLLFYDEGTSSIQHVTMYIGGGQVIQAPETGEVVSITTMWTTDGLVGAGRP